MWVLLIDLALIFVLGLLPIIIEGVCEKKERKKREDSKKRGKDD